MVRVIAATPFAAEFIDEGGFQVEAANLFDLVARIEALRPGFATFAETRATLAVNGVIASDWSAPLAPGSEVLLVPRIAGG